MEMVCAAETNGEVISVFSWSLNNIFVAGNDSISYKNAGASLITFSISIV